jgi:hypothetical protein
MAHKKMNRVEEEEEKMEETEKMGSERRMTRRTREETGKMNKMWCYS